MGATNYAFLKRVMHTRNAEEKTPEGGAETQFMRYPENLVTDIGLEAVFGINKYGKFTADQYAGLEHVISMLSEKQKKAVQLRYNDRLTFQKCADQLGCSRQRVYSAIDRILKKLRQPENIAFIRDGYLKTELTLMKQSVERIRDILQEQKKRRPLMTEEDAVKLVFQGMLGVGHLVISEETASERLHEEMERLEPDADEPLVEWVSPEWFRLNLRAAKAKGITEERIARMLFQSAQRNPLGFTRKNVYTYCTAMDHTTRMREVAERVLDETWLPSHSEQYRHAYHPAYRVLHKDFMRYGKKKGN